MNTSSIRAGHLTTHPSSRTGRVGEEETTEAGITGTRTVVGMEVVGGVEAEVGKETGVGEGAIVGSNTGMTETERETETETETGTQAMGVGIRQDLQAPTRDTTPIIRDHIMTVTDLFSNLSGVVSIHSGSLRTRTLIQYTMAKCNCRFFLC